MNILCLCPTYGRPKLLANALACFLCQDYPAHKRKLLILDDAGQFAPQRGEGWELLSTRERFASLPDKYNAMLAHDGLIGREPSSTPEISSAVRPGYRKTLTPNETAVLKAGLASIGPQHLRERFASDKYNYMLEQERVIAIHEHAQENYWDAVAVWDDDDIYLPWHLSAAAGALMDGAPSCKPSTIWSLYRPDGAIGEGPWKESGDGRFHCSLVIGTPALQRIGGWIQTRRADFDQQQIAACSPAADMLPFSPDRLPSFVYRWGSTGTQHCSALMKSPDNTDWYDRFAAADSRPAGRLVPEYDPETLRVLRTVVPVGVHHAG